jgi:hypothetical protein
MPTLVAKNGGGSFLFFGVEVLAFLQGFLRKTVCRTWFFDGKSVVEWW